MDAEDHRRTSREAWDSVAAGWQLRERWLSETSAPVSAWLIDALGLQPGHRLLELAAGTADAGLMAAELIAPGGWLICSDQSEAMLAAARRRAGERGLQNVEFKLIDGEWIDLPVAAVDRVICRWGYMLMADPATSLRETRRVLRPGGRLALAVWDRAEGNPWATIPTAALAAHGLVEPADPGQPGPFALGDPGLVGELLEGAGFTGIVVESLDLLRPDPDFATWWEGHIAMSPVLRRVLAAAAPQTLASARAQTERALAPYTALDGSLAVPARTLVAVARA